jgi:hypothetical protein
MQSGPSLALADASEFNLFDGNIMLPPVIVHECAPYSSPFFTSHSDLPF